ncbi:hypothetical protein TRAPUB_2526 [Trametes pubescens]|uniref:F-box domain-containing protein n=1 Tax=Trametes pubescens TaxID=154538 RepID=A0A1M2VG89_TRAPU|nr:hypothetical protein TRAPUB_2526 [Trametes pubescens]
MAPTFHWMQAPSTPPASRSSLRFQHLQKFSVVTLMSNIHNLPRQTASALPHTLLSSIVFPPQCLVYISPLLPTDMNALVDRMSTLITPSSMRVIDATQTPGGSGRISFALVQPSESRGVRYSLALGNHNEDTETIRRSIRFTMAASPLFSAIRELWVDTGAIELICGAQSTVLRSLTLLEYLSVGCSSVDNPGLHEVLAVLSAVCAQGDAFVCPKLNTLSLIGFVPVEPERLIAQLRLVLAVRNGLEKPLTHLALCLDLEGEALVDARMLGSLVEHFSLNDPEVEAPAEIEWERYWEDRVPAGCGATDEICDHWPVWK